ncbi:YjbF family lipoprotein [Martelella alba]|uniref:YjbF family lipoprotein n=1 Tax=Martelella alba TaxID=2590451 RepID=A0ABY2SIY1_9HYPH|nr:YjbF family lipoprotein [Martelella alba]TKI04408.1 YjbF family lipoprotein [Martelella alba]
MRYLFLLVVCFLVAACSQSQKSLGETFKVAAFGMPDVEMTPEQVRDIPYASMYARVNNGPQIFVVLAYAENGNLKWVTRDKAMLVTRNGRLIKTLDLTDNLLDVTNLSADPLIHANRITDGAQWTRTQTWTESRKVYTATFTSRFTLAGNETLTILGAPHTARILDEDVDVAELHTHYRNRYWIDPVTGGVYKTQQFIGPDFFPVETTTLNPYKP